MLHFEQVEVHAAGFPEPLLSGLDFTLTAGTVLTLVGPPGCGKSTALALVAGGLAPTRGKVLLHDREPGVLRSDALLLHRRGLGIVPQRGGLLANLSLSDNITLPLRYHGGADAETAQVALKRLLRRLEIEDPPTVQASNASPMWRWITSLARALILEPGLLLVDDLGGELDLTHREDLWRLLWRISTEHGVTILATTSDRAAARTLGDRLIELPGRQETSFRLLRASSLATNPYTPGSP
jgi:ABC-type lipoprotein export system ATPase subunit